MFLRKMENKPTKPLVLSVNFIETKQNAKWSR